MFYPNRNSVYARYDYYSSHKLLERLDKREQLMLANCTILTCSYNTPEYTMTMLKSFVVVHGFTETYNLLIIDNSTDEETAKLLAENNIEYIRNPGGRHSTSIDCLISNCRTDYALLVDTDIIFQLPMYKLLKVIQEQKGTLLGDVCGNRGGFNLHPRVQPWFCMINVSDIKKHGIKWHDEKRIKESNSDLFYAEIPFNPNKGNKILFYDNGATFYEDINKAGLKIIDAKGIRNYFRHYEGASWHRTSGHPGFTEFGNKRYERFKNMEFPRYAGIDIKDRFRLHGLRIRKTV